MSGQAELLRAVAKAMRERAEAATPGPWYPLAHQYEVIGDSPVSLNPEGDDFETASMDYEPNRAHIASWHPAVALAVADWLDHEADRHESLIQNGGRGLRADGQVPNAFTVAAAYLGQTP